MSDAGKFVPGTFSQVGRTTAYDIENLQNQLKLGGSHEVGGADDEDAKPPKADAHHSKSKAPAKGSVATKKQDDTKPKTPGGELAKAIQEKLSASSAKESEEAKHAATAAKDNHIPYGERNGPKAYTFKSEQGDSKWVSKFTATYDIGSLNNRKEDHPDPAWYQVSHDGVLDRPPAWDVQEHPKHEPSTRYGFKPKGEDSSASMTFFTDIDAESKEPQKELTARQRSILKSQAEKAPRKIPTTMALNSERGPLGKIGRTHVIMNDHSCAYDGDLLEQDIKGYHKLRYPRWDFEAPAARGPLIKPSDVSEPGKYDYTLDCVHGKPKCGVGFGIALPRSQFVGFMGYSAPPAVLHPEEKRTRGALPDRSKSKNFVRQRITHVNDFDREMPRPPLNAPGNDAYHDESDPAACEAVHQRSLTYDASTADVAVTHRRDIVPKYDRMIGRGRDAVQGLRALSSDLGVRGSVGLGFAEISNDLHPAEGGRTVKQREGRHMDGSKENGNLGPKFRHRTVHEHNEATRRAEKMLRGAPVVKGPGLDAKPPPLLKKDHKVLTNAFKRSASLPGFESRSKYGGTRILSQSRSSIAMPGWSPTQFDGE